MPFHRPIPEQKTQAALGRKSSGITQSLVQAEKLMQIAFVLPCAMVIGWGAGWLVDHRFHSHWATFVGLVFGIVAGMVSMIRMAMTIGNPPPNSPKPRGGK